jgi:uncharacterized circularly permuted ATP-grasp superfamily protein
VTARRRGFHDRAWDEVWDPDGAVRPHYAEVLEALGRADVAELAREVARGVEEADITLGLGEEARHYRYDAVPRVFTAEEWDGIAAGVAQRVRALDLFVRDFYGPREAVRAGVVPEELVEASSFYEPDMRDVPAPAVRIGVAGPDVVRDEDGSFVVLEDNTRTPSLMGYALAARRLVGERLDVARSPQPIAAPLAALTHWALRAAAPDLEEPSLVLLGDGRRSEMLWELHALGSHLGIRVVEPEDLRRDGDRLVIRDGALPVDVLWRRTNADSVRDEGGELTHVGELLLPSLRAGTARVVNAFGTGIADDKRTYPYVEDLIRFFLGEEPRIRSVPTYDPVDPEGRADVLERLHELVVKPRGGAGGFGVVIGPIATRDELEEVRRALERDPERYLVQSAVPFSTHPTWVDGELRPRHGDVRAFAFSDGKEVRVLPGGISRWPIGEGALVTNSIQGGGAKDVWVLPSPGLDTPSRGMRQ